MTWPDTSRRGGSLFQSVMPAAVTSASYDLANRLTSRTVAGATASPTWDTNGNLTGDGVQTYTWDARNRLTGIGGVTSFSSGADRHESATGKGWPLTRDGSGGSLFTVSAALACAIFGAAGLTVVMVEPTVAT
jgi:YD repeat-containing protein